MTLALDCTALRADSPAELLSSMQWPMHAHIDLLKLALNSRRQCTAACLGPGKNQYSSKWHYTDSPACLAFKGRAVPFRERCWALAVVVVNQRPSRRREGGDPGSTLLEPCWQPLGHPQHLCLSYIQVWQDQYQAQAPLQPLLGHTGDQLTAHLI